MNAQDQQQADRDTAAEAEDLYLTGAHLVTERNGYVHHGIYAGHGRVIHYAGFCHALHAAPVEETTLEHFAAGHAIAVKLEPCARYLGQEAVQRARTRLGENHYHLLTNNCEHFCTWCLLGEARSEQVEACLHHPRAAVQTVLQLLKTLLTSNGNGSGSGLHAA